MAAPTPEELASRLAALEAGPGGSTLAEVMRALEQRWQPDSAFFPRPASAGPFVAPGGSLGAGGSTTQTVNHRLGTSEIVVVGHLEGPDSDHCTWGVGTLTTTSVQIKFFNAGPTTADPALHFYILH